MHERDAPIEDPLQSAGVTEDPTLRRDRRMRSLQSLNAALVNQRRVDGLVRELQLKLPRLIDFSLLEVMILGRAASQLFVFQSRPVEHEAVLRLADEMCQAVTPFSEQAVTPESLTFVEATPATRSDDSDPAAAAVVDNPAITVPMVFCGELVGAIGVLPASAEVDAEPRTLLQLVAHQLAASVRNAQTFESAEGDVLVDAASRPVISERASQPRRKALVVTPDAALRATMQRVMSAAHYDVEIHAATAEVEAALLEDYSLLVLGESALKELAPRIQRARTQRAPGRPSLRIAVISESQDRRAALDTILAHRADHLFASDPSEDILFATVSKLVLDRHFGLEKYLLWGSQNRSWRLNSSDEKVTALEGIKRMADEVGCHPRIADLLLAAADEMIINALFRPLPVDSETGRSRRPVTVECGADGRFLGIAVTDQQGLFSQDDLFRGIAKALKHEQQGIAEQTKSASIGFRIMLTTLSHLAINVDPGRCTEVIGLVDLRQSMKDYRTTVPSLGMFTSRRHK